MKRQTEIELAREVLDLHASRSTFAVADVSTNPVDVYLSDQRFEAERDLIFRRIAQPVIHSSSLQGRDAFLRRDIAGVPVLFTRDADGNANAFVNVCRHRGTRLVNEPSGCSRRFACPYHAWTWNNKGELVGVPHHSDGFPDMDRQQMGLKRLGCTEQHGWLWLHPESDKAPVVDELLGELSADFDWFAGSALTVMHTDTQMREANWKIIVEGGLESYHFKVAHRATIAPYFLDNLSTYRRFGMNLRSVLPKSSIVELAATPQKTWRLRDHAQVLYNIFPLDQLLVQSDHVAWIQQQPVSATSTRIQIHTLAPADRVERDEDLAHWAKNHAITVKTLNEDFDLAESIQDGLNSGANVEFTFGRFEGALSVFNRSVNSLIESGS